MINFNKKRRVRRSVNPNNRIMINQHGVRQVLFLYMLLSNLVYKNVPNFLLIDNNELGNWLRRFGDRFNG